MRSGAERRVDEQACAASRRRGRASSCATRPAGRRRRRRPSQACSTRAHVAQSGMAQITIASESLTIATRNAPTSSRPSSSRAGTACSRTAAEEVGRGAGGHRHQLVGCRRRPARRRRSASRSDRVHGSGTTMRSTPAAPQRGRDRPPLGERRVLRAGADQLVAEVADETVPPVELPHVDDLGPPPGRPHRRPHAEAQLVALLDGDRAPSWRSCGACTGRGCAR